jgi:hypothetical protein
MNYMFQHFVQVNIYFDSYNSNKIKVHIMKSIFYHYIMFSQLNLTSQGIIYI